MNELTFGFLTRVIAFGYWLIGTLDAAIKLPLLRDWSNECFLE
jgi:hypothetical protein